MFESYPNIELLVYKTKEILYADDTFKKRLKEKKEKNSFVYLSYDVIVFSQIWGSTNTGFDITENGETTIGGSAMTKEYTTIVHETSTDTYVIFFGKEAAYIVTNATERFYEDLKNRNMASLSEAKKLY